MRFHDELTIAQLEESKRYAITDGGNGYSDGVWIIKNGDEITVRNFWDKDIPNENGYYTYHEKDDVCYPKDKDSDITYVIHKDVLEAIPGYTPESFETMGLVEFYEAVVVYGIEAFREKAYRAPEQLKGKIKIYNAASELIETI